LAVYSGSGNKPSPDASHKVTMGPARFVRAFLNCRFFWDAAMRRIFYLAVAVLCIVGCSEVREASQKHKIASTAGPAEEPAVAQAAKEAAGQQAGGKPAGEAVPRKIIYTADVSLVVTDFEKAGDELLQLVIRSKGFVAKSEIIGSAGSPRTGHWRIRLP